VNAALPPGQPPFTRERLVRSVRLFVREGLAEPALLERAPRRMTRNPKARRAMELAASFAVADLFPGSWTVAVAGGLSILLGYLLLAASPSDGILAIVWAIGIYAIFYGITLIYAGSQMRSLAKGQ